MKREEYNEESFIIGEEDEKFQKLLEYLFLTDDKSYNDIHITSDGYCRIVEWVPTRYDVEEYCGKFRFVDENQSVMTECELPDGTITLCFDEEEFNEELNKFLEEDKKKGIEWKKNIYGHWYREDEISREM